MRRHPFARHADRHIYYGDAANEPHVAAACSSRDSERRPASVGTVPLENQLANVVLGKPSCPENLDRYIFRILRIFRFANPVCGLRIIHSLRFRVPRFPGTTLPGRIVGGHTTVRMCVCACTFEHTSLIMRDAFVAPVALALKQHNVHKLIRMPANGHAAANNKKRDAPDNRSVCSGRSNPPHEAFTHARIHILYPI